MPSRVSAANVAPTNSACAGVGSVVDAEGSVPGWKRIAISAAEPSVSPTRIAANTFVLADTRRIRINNAIGQSRYHCSSIASDHVWARGDGAWNAWKYDEPSKMNRQLDT